MLIMLGTFLYSRRCDSRNLNLSPLCDLASEVSPYLWLKSVKETYEQNAPGQPLPEYISSKIGPERKMYPTLEAKKKELISSIAKVVILIFILK